MRSPAGQFGQAPPRAARGRSSRARSACFACFWRRRASSSLAQLLGPLGGDRRGRLLALGVALRRRPRPLAQAADVAALGEGEQREHGEAEERGQAREAPTLESAGLTQGRRDRSFACACGSRSADARRAGGARLVSRHDGPLAVSPPGAVIISTTRSARLASSPASTRCSSEFEGRLDPIGVERGLAHRPADPLRGRRLARSRPSRTAPRAASRPGAAW